MGSLSWIKAYLRTSRSEYLLAETPALFLVFFISATSFYRLLAPEVIEGIVAFVLLYFVGFIINAYTDQDIDKNYTIFKNKIPEAVETIGQKNIKGIIVGQIVIANLLGALISYQMSSWIPVVLVMVGTFFGIGYSIPPLQFKVRGIMHAVSLTLSAFFIPGIFLLFVIGNGLTLWPFILIVGFSILHYGIAFANQAIDYLEDKENGVKSPPVRWGMATSLRVALTMIVLGMLVEFIGLFFIIALKGGATGTVLGLNPMVLFALFVPVVILGYYIPASGLWKMYRATITKPIEEATNYMKTICHYNQWQASGILGLAAVTGVLFIGTLVLG
jgi:4-hydroxybenzoate polyprenyltransferase